MNKLIKLPTPHGEMELLWSQELYQGFVPEQHGGTLLYNGDKYFTTLKSISELDNIVSPNKAGEIPTRLKLEGGNRYTRELSDYLINCHKEQTPVIIGHNSHFIIENITYNTCGGRYLDIEGFLV